MTTPSLNDDPKIKELWLKEAEDLAQTLATRYKLPYLDISKTSINTDALRLIPEKDARQAEVVAFSINGKNVSLALTSPNRPEAQLIIEDLKNKNLILKIFVISEPSFQNVVNQYAEIGKSVRVRAGLIDISNEKIIEYVAKFKNITDIHQELEGEMITFEKTGGVSAILEIILAGGLALEASDVHIEPEKDQIRLRYRLDGVLQDILDFPPKIFLQLISRFKLVSGMKINIKQMSQDGRFSINYGQEEIEIRSSVIPSAYGESVVMRILNPKSINVTFSQLGIEKKLYDVFDQEIHKPNGMILLTGPTGSGKTTTLYAFLREINSPESKIITIEDPIEYHLEGINQTQVNRKKGYTFLSGLRSALRQDPDIILVGEVRDAETAKIAVQSSLTGHLVFSSLHTNNAEGAIPRLIDLGVNAKIITSALTLSIAQRLVRKLCPVCKKVYTPTADEKKLIEDVLVSAKKKRPDLVPDKWDVIYDAVGCDKCHQTGYKGREGIFEAIVMDKVVAEAAITNPSEKDIKTAALPQRILDMRQDGILKVVAGKTTLSELSRIIDLSEEII
ncbi:MAG: GspE/PulE family protein [Candidatus Vogelbacteria bacterium]|nr:GspE/PulE family protein [Candidatus Vogelbacteria bacterium]